MIIPLQVWYVVFYMEGYSLIISIYPNPYSDSYFTGSWHWIRILR